MAMMGLMACIGDCPAEMRTRVLIWINTAGLSVRMDHVHVQH